MIPQQQWSTSYPGGLGVIIFASGSEDRGFDPGRGRWIFSDGKYPEYDFLRKGSKALRHIKELQAEIWASEENLSAFSRSMSEATLMS